MKSTEKSQWGNVSVFSSTAVIMNVSVKNVCGGDGQDIMSGERCEQEVESITCLTTQ